MRDARIEAQLVGAGVVHPKHSLSTPGTVNRLAASAWPSAGNCSASTRPPPNHPPSEKTTATVTSGSPANHCATAPCAARATCFALKVCPAASHEPRQVPTMRCSCHCTRFQTRLPFPARQTRPDPCLRSASAPEYLKTTGYGPAKASLLHLSSARPPPIAGNPVAAARLGHQKYPRWSFNAHSGHRLRSGLAQMVFCYRSRDDRNRLRYAAAAAIANQKILCYICSFRYFRIPAAPHVRAKVGIHCGIGGLLK